jgi:hypothetical protein
MLGWGTMVDARGIASNQYFPSAPLPPVDTGLGRLGLVLALGAKAANAWDAPQRRGATAMISANFPSLQRQIFASLQQEIRFSR